MSTGLVGPPEHLAVVQAPCDPQAPVLPASSSAQDGPVLALRVLLAERTAFWLLMGALGGLYFWHLGAVGWGNGYYAAAVQAGSRSWEAAFFGSLDPANAITVDKTPAALWVMELSVRLFGMSPGALNAPQVVEGLGIVAVVYAITRRAIGRGGALAAAAAAGTAPVLVLLSRYDNPDPFLVLLFCASWWAVMRSLHDGRSSWAALAGALVGVAFLAKELEALMVLPAFAIGYLFWGHGSFAQRLKSISLLSICATAAAVWWPAVVEAVPPGRRPYAGGSSDNSVWDVIFGYNGVYRLSGHEGGTSQEVQLGLHQALRLFEGAFAFDISWLLPLSLLLMAGGVVMLSRSEPRSHELAALVIAGTWLLTMAAAFSFGAGIINAYYSVAVVPPMAVAIGIGGGALWRARRHRPVRLYLAGAAAINAVWELVLLDRAPTWCPWLRALVCVGAAVAMIWLLGPRCLRSVAHFGGPFALVALLIAPVGYSVATVVSPPIGSNPVPPLIRGEMALPPAGSTETISRPSEPARRALRQGAARYRWAAAVVGANPAAGYELAVGEPVMAIGGFEGTDPYPSLSTFQHLVSQGRIHYFISPGLPQAASRDDDAFQIETWVETHFHAKHVGSVRLYELPRPTVGAVRHEGGG